MATLSTGAFGSADLDPADPYAYLGTPATISDRDWQAWQDLDPAHN